MNDQNVQDQPATVEPAKPAKVRKSSRKPAKAKKEDKPQANGHLPVTKPQVRMLKALAKAKHPLTDAALASKASVARTWIAGFAFKAGASNTKPSLVEQLLAKPIELDIDGKRERAYELTAAGRKLAGKL